jgi:uncharacterized protein YbjT (DUF2867 family)
MADCCKWFVWLLNDCYQTFFRSQIMSKNSNLHVVFGSGPLGLSVVDELLQQGAKVRVVNRSGKADVPDQVEVVQADINDPSQAVQACKDAAYVYQCAQPPYHQWVEKFPQLHQNILEASAAAGARLIIGDNLYMYGEVDGPIHEELPYTATTRKVNCAPGWHKPRWMLTGKAHCGL